MVDYWEQMCAWMRLWHALFVMSSVVLIMILISAFIAPPGTDGYYINLFNIAFILPTSAGLLYVMIRCRKRDE